MVIYIKMIVLKALYILLLHFNLIFACLLDSCKRQKFPEIPGAEYNGQYFVHKGPWPQKYCLRHCRQYVECVAFTMEWIGIEKQFGYCGLIHRNVHMHQNVLSTPATTGRSLFGELKLYKATYKIIWFSCQ